MYVAGKDLDARAPLGEQNLAVVYNIIQFHPATP